MINNHKSKGLCHNSPDKQNWPNSVIEYNSYFVLKKQNKLSPQAETWVGPISQRNCQTQDRKPMISVCFVSSTWQSGRYGWQDFFFFFFNIVEQYPIYPIKHAINSFYIPTTNKTVKQNSRRLQEDDPEIVTQQIL